MVIVEMETFLTLPSGPAVISKGAPVTWPFGAVNQETIASLGLIPVSSTPSGVPTLATWGDTWASTEGGIDGNGVGAATGTIGVGSGPPYIQR